MEISEFSDVPVIDCHFHFRPGDDPRRSGESIVEIIRKGRLSQMYASSGEAALYLKVKYPGLFYAGGFVPWSGDVDRLPEVDWPSYINVLIKAGFDAVGEMGSKTVPRDRHTSLKSDYYRGLWDVCESTGYPVLCHVADPEEFWDENLAPDWAKERGWVYYLGDYPSKEELYKEMENVLDTHPDLKIVLCHFYFMSASLERSADFLDRYKNANFDLALGIELMYNISRRREDWREFFLKYQDQILFGTDIGTWQTIQESIDRVWLIRNFLESDEEFSTPRTADNLLTRYEEPFIGLKLPERALRRIYFENFQRLWGGEPKKVDIDLAVRFCEERGQKVISDALRSPL